jgi:hypothetical protein
LAQKLGWRTIPGKEGHMICPCPVCVPQARSSRPADAPNSRKRRNAERWPVSTRHEHRGECPRPYSNRTTPAAGRYSPG